MGAEAVKRKKISKRKSKERRVGTRTNKEELKEVDAAELNRAIRRFDRDAPDQFIPELRLMTDAERRIYERRN